MAHTAATWGKPAPFAERGSTAASSLLRVVDGGLCGIVFVAPYFFGGRHDVGRLVFATLVAVTAVAWFTRQALLPVARWPRTLAYPLLLLAVALVVVQIVPLPVGWLAHLSPRIGQFLPLWTPTGSEMSGLGNWQTLSLVPHETTKALAMLVSYSLLFVVVIGRIGETADVQRMLNWIGLSAVLMATFGLLQHFTSDGRFFWFYQHPHRSTTQGLSGPFINRNHFADFLVMGVGPLVAWLLVAVRDLNAAKPVRPARHKSPLSPKQILSTWALAAGATLLVLTILLSRSRGGALVLLGAGAVLAAIYLSRGLADGRFVYGLIALAVVVIGLLSIHGYDQVAQRLDDFAEGSMDDIDHDGMRRQLWTANLDAIAAGWTTGAGVGSHCEICPVYLPQSYTKEYTHAENGYLQIATETGVAGVVLLVGAIALVGAWCIRCWRHAADADAIRLFGAAAAGLAASAVHSLVDFVWYIPACMSIVVILAGCMLRLSQLARTDKARTTPARHLPRGRWLEMTVAATLVGGWTIHTYFGPAVAAVYWDRYLRASVVNSELAQQQTTALVDSRPATESSQQGPLNDVMLHQLEQVVRWDPQFARAHLRLAAKCIAEFELLQQHAENAMSLAQIRDAAANSSFASTSERQAWLTRAVGGNLQWLRRAAAEARLAVSLCPLQGEGYIYLSQLSFLDGTNLAANTQYVDQGLRVRPHDADVLFEVGRQELLAGDLTNALERWKQCFHDAGPHQQKIVFLLAGRIPAAMFVATFEPDWQTLREIWNHYRASGQPGDLDALLKYAADQTQSATGKKSDIPPAFIWYWQSQFFADAGRSDDALNCLERAYQSDPRHYFIRYALARSLQAAGRYAEAEPHYRWCLARRPADKTLSKTLVLLSKQRLAQRELTLPTKQQQAKRGARPIVASASTPST